MTLPGRSAALFRLPIEARAERSRRPRRPTPTTTGAESPPPAYACKLSFGRAPLPVMNTGGSALPPGDSHWLSAFADR